MTGWAVIYREDAMSPVPAPRLPPALDFPMVAEAGLCTLREVGVNLVRTRDLL